MSEGSDDVCIDINHGSFMDNTLDGVVWNGNNEDKRRFPEAFTEVLRTCSLTGRSKLIIRERFLNLYRKYRKKHKYTNIYHNSSRIIVSMGSIIIPALLTLDNEISERSLTSQSIYYTTFGISMLVTLTNAISELTQISKKYYTYATMKDSLETEGWSFMSLSGKYKNYTDHTECWRRFVHKIEKLNTSAVNSNLILSTHKLDDTTTNPRVAWNQLGLDTRTEGTEGTETTEGSGDGDIIYSAH
jgi:hypothetical protein